MVSLRRAWRWTTGNVIDLRKGAAIDSAGVVTLLVVLGVQRGLTDPVGLLMLAAAAALLPLVWRCWRNYLVAERQQGRPELPALDQPAGAEPPSNVRRVQ